MAVPIFRSFLSVPNTLALALLFCAAPVAAAPAPAEGRAAMQSGIQAAYDGLGAAFSRHDLPRFMSFFTDDYVNIDEKGTHLTKEQTRRGYEKQLGQLKSIESHYTIQNFAPAGGGTLVEMKMHSRGTGEKRVLFARLHGTFTNDLWVRDLWVSTPQGWRLRRRQTLQDDLHIHPG